MSKKVEKVKKITATKRLEALEELVLGFQQRFMILADEIDKISSGLLATTKTIDGLLEATKTREAVNDIVVNGHVKEMENKVSMLVEQGLLIKQEGDDAMIGDRSYVVGRELDPDGNVINPRLHFAVPSINEVERDLFLGKKAGEVVMKDSEAAIGVEIVEIFNIKEQSKEE